MRVLPAATRPPAARGERRHQPPEGSGEESYQSFRPCLRWDFGFTCAFCLIHERDLMHEGVDGWTVFTIEHLTRQKEDSTRINDYSNCYWCCRRCNTARGTKDRVTPEGHLLDPWTTSWGERFDWEDPAMPARDPDDRDAVRTSEVYDLDDPGKVRRKRARAKALSEAIALWRDAQQSFALLSLDDDSFLADLQKVRRVRMAALATLARFEVVPDDDPRDCRCGDQLLLRLPDWLHRQCWTAPSG